MPIIRKLPQLYNVSYASLYLTIFVSTYLCIYLSIYLYIYISRNLFILSFIYSIYYLSQCIYLIFIYLSLLHFTIIKFALFIKVTKVLANFNINIHSAKVDFTFLKKQRNFHQKFCRWAQHFTIFGGFSSKYWKCLLCIIIGKLTNL